jgi:hypothetical protein
MTGRGGLLQLLDISLSPCCPYRPAGVSCRLGQPATCHAAFATKQGARPPDLYFVSRPLMGYFRYGPVTRSPSLRWVCRSASSASLSSADTTQAKGLLTFAPVGLPPTEHVCFFFWRHCFAKIPCALKIVRFPATMAASHPFTLERQESVPVNPSGIPIYIYKDGGTRTSSRRCVGSD